MGTSIKTATRHQIRTMGLGELAPSDDGDSGGNQSTYVTFKNPAHPDVDIDEDDEIRHKQEYYDAVQQLRDMMGQNINVAFGEFAAAAVEAEKNGNPEPLEELFNTLTT